MVQDSWLQIASTATNAVALVRESRKRPAFDSTSAAPPMSATGDPPTVTCTPDPAKRPLMLPSIAAGAPGDEGDDGPPPHPEKNVASVAPDATWQAPAQKRRRET